MAIEEQLISDIERQRLNTLDSYNMLDTLPEKEYDAIARLASFICNTPISLISLINIDRPWFKSNVGMDGYETRCADAFCSDTMRSDEILKVKDALKSEVFKDNIHVQGDPRVRFYAGVPLTGPCGYRLGSLHVMDSVPRELTEEQRDALKNLATEVMSHSVLRKEKQMAEENLMDLRELSEAVPRSMRFRATEKNIYLKYNVDKDVPEIMMGDRTKICQILLNLAGNSLKFTENGGITIDLKVTEQTQNNVTIRFAVTLMIPVSASRQIKLIPYSKRLSKPKQTQHANMAEPDQGWPLPKNWWKYRVQRSM